jgi:SWI/SNF-related matrix-associated actin-dependent regulator 1 of chromatin subfamily A
MTYEIKLSGPRGREVLWTTAPSIDGGKWLGAQGLWYLGPASEGPSAARARAAGVPVHGRYLPVERAESLRARLSVPAVSWAPAARALVAGAQAAIEQSWAIDAEIDIPAPEGLSYRPYQRAGVAAALAALRDGKRGVILGDEMGLGKTMQAIGLLSTLGPDTRAVVVCPASLRSNWSREIGKWLPSARVQILDGKPVAADVTIVVANYDLAAVAGKRAATVREQLAAHAAGAVLILDEVHVLKNPTSKRTRFVLGSFTRGALTAPGLVQSVRFTACLTGTPIQNRVRESLPLLLAIGAVPGPIAKSEGSFLFRYCDPQKVRTGRGTYATTFDGASHVDELALKLRTSGAMVRRLKRDVATELPPKLRNVVALPAPEGWVDGLADEGDVLDIGDTTVCTPGDFASAVGALRGRKVSFDALSAERARIAAAKVEGVCDYLATQLDAGGKLIVFAHHQLMLDAIEALCAKLEVGAMRIDGSVPAADRQALVDRFQTDAACRVAILSTHAAGVGLTLTAANTVVFAEADWNPSWCVQAEDRAHRIGQDADVVTATYLVLDDSVDARVVRTMVAKMDLADRVLDRQRAAAPAPVAPPPPPPPVAAPARERKVRVESRTGDAYEIQLTDDRVAAIGEGLVLLAGQCDGARRQDEVGFTGRDARSDFVQALVATARAGKLSDRQAAWGAKVLRTYHKTQLPDALVARIWRD